MLGEFRAVDGAVLGHAGERRFQWRDRGAAYYFKEDHATAIKNYDEAIRLDPKSDQAFTNRGSAYKKMGRNEQALADESEAIKLDPNLSDAFYNRGSAKLAA